MIVNEHAVVDPRAGVNEVHCRSVFAESGRLRPVDIAGSDREAVDKWRVVQAQAGDHVVCVLGGASARVVVAQQIAASVIRASGDRVEVRLDPPELGRVALSFQIRDDLVIAHVSADKSETSDLLRRNGDDLQRALKEGGFGDVELDFSGGGEAQEGQTRAKTGAENTARTESQPILARAAKTGALDLRI